MTEQSRHWDGVSLGDATMAPYSASEWADQEKIEHGLGVLYPNYGVIQNTGNGSAYPLAVSAKSPASANIEIAPGAALVRGYLYENSAALTFTVGANASGNPRIDTAILRADLVAQTVRAVIKQGTPAASPVRVAMQQDTSIWEIPLADIAVANGFSTLPQATISQRQRFIIVQSWGWADRAYPVDYCSGLTIDRTVTLIANGGIYVIEINVPANMLLEKVSFLVDLGGGTAYAFGWGLYREEINDSVVADAVLRRVANSDGTFSGTAASATVLTGQCESRPVPLTPGVYWLALQNRHASNTLAVRGGTGNIFDNSLHPHRQGFQAIPLPASIDGSGASLAVVIGTAPAVALFGRVFGELS